MEWVAIGGLGALLYYAVLVEPYRPEHTVLDLWCPGLPEGLDGGHILHLTDIHTTGIGYREVWLQDLLHRTSPDLVLITGDLVSGPRGISPALEVLSGIKARLGAFAVRGNNEVEELADDDTFYEGLRRLSIVPLRNEHRVVDVGGEPLVVAGVDDPNNGLDDLDRALAGAPPGAFTVLLSHTPETFDDAAGRGIELVVSGHTHGGQVRLPYVGTLWSDTPRTGRRYTSGLYRRGTSALIVSRGLGWSLLPVRFLCRPQVVELRLHKARAGQEVRTVHSPASL